MAYHINEGTLNLGLPFQDRSLNLLSLKTPDSGPVQVVITRDQLQGVESLRQNIERQLLSLERQVKRFVRLSQGELMVGSKRWPAVAVHTRFEQDAQTVEQLQVAAHTAERSTLVFTFSATQPIHQRDIDLWLDKIGQFEAR